MKNILIVFLSFFCYVSTAQNGDKQAIQQTIETFFDGFHKQDSMLIKSTVMDEIIMQRIGTDSLGMTHLKTNNFGKFLSNIVGIPKDVHFEEKIVSYHIQTDGKMANAWTPYEFWLNDSLSHCGVNSFQLMKVGDAWKILYIIDTAQKEGCE